MTVGAYKMPESFTPEELGEIFACMPDDEQARFFNGIADSTRKWADNAGYGYGEMQWLCLRKEMLKPENKEGLAAWQSMSVWALLHAWEEYEHRD